MESDAFTAGLLASNGNKGKPPGAPGTSWPRSYRKIRDYGIVAPTGV